MSASRPQTYELYQPYDPVERILDVVRRFEEVERAILYGSRARGDHRPRSDVDLAIVAPDMGLGVWQDLKHAVEHDARTLIGCDLVRLDDASGAFRENIERYGEVVYERA